MELGIWNCWALEVSVIDFCNSSFFEIQSILFTPNNLWSGENTFLHSRNTNLVCHNSFSPFFGNVGRCAEMDLERGCMQVAEHPLCQWLVWWNIFRIKGFLKIAPFGTFCTSSLHPGNTFLKTVSHSKVVRKNVIPKLSALGCCYTRFP